MDNIDEELAKVDDLVAHRMRNLDLSPTNHVLLYWIGLLLKKSQMNKEIKNVRSTRRNTTGSG